ncbi:hypothetical protein C791_1090 [Amycolatopsis azurea DSM 43854]|uniref:Uncharacterized protein n=1 Tax=Amycolatopsis azurea DSM 43854 TaxID=1238180 RepID=M2QP32_9PSEU|nr:hypothetical protein C791_1090 [Amycolatopsis azurea DSM 43854]
MIRGKIKDMVLISERPPRLTTDRCQASGKAASSSAKMALRRSRHW